MTYHVLARKWRPQTFSDLVGQTHVVKALTFALSENQVHHAYLFTGTRGVGKTSIARIFAKSLNCETNGVSPTPCGECESCREIKSGKFVDLIEVDAASRTGVDETRELIDSVAYQPSKGRFKVYLIDEVHMFSKSSFNALLKTLEEPPEHVKFILATTDPEKLPITILSRCLQFNLKSLTQSQIKQHLVNICEAESIAYDNDALALLANAGDGSMRDTLSMTDQAIAYGQGELNMQAVTEILGTIQPMDIEAILFAVATNNPVQLNQALKRLDNYEVDARAFLIEIMRRLQQMTWAKEGIVNDLSKTLLSTVNDIPKPLLHLWYDIAEKALPNLGLSGDARSAVEMTLLRMLAFTPNDWVPRQRTPLDSLPDTNSAEPHVDNVGQDHVAVASQAENHSTTSENTASTDTPPWEAEQPTQTPQPESVKAQPITAQDSLEAAEAVFASDNVVESEQQADHVTDNSLDESKLAEAWHLGADDATSNNEPAPTMADVNAIMQRGSDIQTPNKPTAANDKPTDEDDKTSDQTTLTTTPEPTLSPVDDKDTATENVVADEPPPVIEPQVFNMSGLVGGHSDDAIDSDDEQAPIVQVTASTLPTPEPTLSEPTLPDNTSATDKPFDWYQVYPQLELSDYAKHFAGLGIMRLEHGDEQLSATFDLSPKNEVLCNEESCSELQEALQNYLASPVRFAVNLTEITVDTPADVSKKQQEKQTADTINVFTQLPVTQRIVNELGGKILAGTIKHSKN